MKLTPKKRRKIFFVGSIVLLGLLFFNLTKARAVKVGGELEVTNDLYYKDSEIKAGISSYGELELFLPASRAVEPRLVFQTKLSGAETITDVKYLYLRRRQENSHLTIGRQPVSWSYGALVNLLDYGLGIDDLADKTVTPGVDGLRYHHSLGSGWSLQGIISFSDLEAVELEDLGYGMRLRLPRGGQDLSFNLSYQPVEQVDSNSPDNLLRAGMTYKGDIKEIGVYGSVGYFTVADNEDVILQLGGDYSWSIGDRRQSIILQTEYFRFLLDDLEVSQLAGLQLGGGHLEDSIGTGLETDVGRDLLVINLSTQPDYFSDLGFALLFQPETEWGVVNPYYTTDLGGGLEFKTEGNLIRDNNGSFNYGLSTGLTYYF